MESTYNLLDELEQPTPGAAENGKAPAPENEIPEVQADDFDSISDDEKEKISGNRTTEQGHRNQESETVLLAQAKLFTGILDMAQKSLCAWVSKMDRENYGFSESEKKDLNNVTVEYLKTVEKPIMTPGEALFLTCATVVGGNVIVALEDKKKKERDDKENAARKKANEARTYAETQAAKEDLDEIMKDKPEPEKVVKRNLFQTDKNGFYQYDEGGNYLKGLAKTEKAPAEILRMLKECKKANMSTGEANEQIRLFLYGSREAV